MSIQTIQPPKTYRLGIIASKSFDDPDFLEKHLSEVVSKISHINTNGINSLSENFAKDYGIPYTVFPICSRSAPWSNSRIIENSDFVYIISTPDSKNSKLAKEECERKKIKYKFFIHDSISFWKNKVKELQEVKENP
jgi:hypothetical protein